MSPHRQNPSTIHPTRRRLIAPVATIIGAVSLLHSTISARGGSGAKGTNQETPSTIVLVHGAFADSSSWNGVVAILQQRGYKVISVANPLRGLQQDASYLRSVIDSVPGPVLVAGHSYGGAVMSEAADGARNVRALVYIASFILEVGESAAELAAKYSGGKLGPALEPLPFPLPNGESGSDLYIRQDQFRAVFAADLPQDVTDLMAATQRPITASALEDKATKTAWKTIPSWTMVTLQDRAIPPDSMHFMAARAGSTTIEVDASHAVAVSQPEAVADLIDTAARTTGTTD